MNIDYVFEMICILIIIQECYFFSHGCNLQNTDTVLFNADDFSDKPDFIRPITNLFDIANYSSRT